ncbi:hypothetical protein EIN_376110 [Entamoeba invadens IP1]|uniref:Uncharacterized protein n=1 Tax=Entamoeba invadens IP1 TaxID=370355 RepID=A0A0A1TY88_ENTIV|nr:hypothetical protein EIN_376110 [Entamoeba invadens IP1]ELP83466.1 hypothetical protein EIN_376110 [Entamoeba invadens IP1]|eukprot:XP_004182812.1 hypothetical protein EIN_376110 [Entamoeba invadens IP1]
MLKDQMNEYTNLRQPDDEEEEQKSDGWLIWSIWVMMTIVAVITFTVSLMSLIFFKLKMESTYQTFQQSTLMLAPKVFTLDSYRLPPPAEWAGFDWGVVESILLGSVNRVNEQSKWRYPRIDPVASNDLYNRLDSSNIPPESNTRYTASFYEANNDSLRVEIGYTSHPSTTFSIGRVKDSLMKANNYPNVPQDKPLHPIILTHASYKNIRTVGGNPFEFDMCYNQNCEVLDQFTARGLRSFSVVGWNDNIRSLGSIRSNGEAAVFQGGFIVRTPSQDVGHTLAYFTGNFSDTKENEICPNLRLRKNWNPCQTHIESTYGMKFDDAKYYSRGEKETITCIHSLNTPTALIVILDDGNKLMKTYDLNVNNTYYLVTSPNAFPKYIKTYKEAVYDILLKECNKQEECNFLGLKEVSEELMGEIFRPQIFVKNGEECSFVLLPYDTLMRMNLLLRPTRINKLGNSFMSYDFVYYNLQMNSSFEESYKNVKMVEFNERLNKGEDDLLFFRIN